MIRLTSEGFQFVLTSEGPKSLQKKEPYCPHDSTGKTVYVHPYKDIPIHTFWHCCEQQGQPNTAYQQLSMQSCVG